MVTSGGNVGDGLNLTGNVVTVLVGPLGTALNIHENLVRSRSMFFAAALKKCWQEGREAQIQLPDDSPETVEHYFQFLYAQKLFVKWTSQPGDLPMHENLPEYITLSHLYVFGEKVGDVRFKNAVVDAFIWRATTPVGDRKWNPVTSAVDIVYRGTMPGSPARQFMVDVHLYRGCAHWITESADDNNKDFLMELTRALIRHRNKQVSTTAPFENTSDRCRYHEDMNGK